MYFCLFSTFNFWLEISKFSLCYASLSLRSQTRNLKDQKLNNIEARIFNIHMLIKTHFILSEEQKYKKMSQTLYSSRVPCFDWRHLIFDTMCCLNLGTYHEQEYRQFSQDLSVFLLCRCQRQRREEKVLCNFHSFFPCTWKLKPHRRKG